jgi:predicted Zn-dependent protease
LAQLVTRLYPLDADDTRFPLHVRVSKNAEINAYAGLAGVITVNTGLLAQAKSAEEVAGVLAHEIGHVQHRDVMQGALVHLLTSQGLNLIFSDGDPSTGTEWTNYFLNMRFSRRQEAAADEAGLLRLQKAHIDNKGFKDFFDRMEDSTADTFLSDHPSNISRSELVSSYKNGAVTPVMTGAQWQALKKYCR